ncbi:MAG: type III polyketide synthase [Planctomycetota bacterium]|nr:type III polyketide synthase [Planctomycetota bacterium]
MKRLSAVIEKKSKAKASVALLGIGTAVPPTLTQQQLADIALERCSFSPEQGAALRRMFMRCGVGWRGTVLASEDESPGQMRDFYSTAPDGAHRGPGTAARMQRYAIEAPGLGEAAATAALSDSQISADAITHLITVSCTGFVAPGLDAELIRRLGLAGDVRRLHVGFMGCHAAFNALAAARDMVLADPEAIVLICCVELCTLHFTYEADPQKLVASALFADGASAVVVAGAGQSEGSTGCGWRLRQTASRVLPGCTDAMAWRVGDHGFEMTLSSEVPELIRSHVHSWCEDWLGQIDLSVGEIENWAVHPGGPKILSVVEDSLSLPALALGCSREILLRHGNMSSNTILFILQALARQEARGNCVAIGFGPGLTMEGMLLER